MSPSPTEKSQAFYEAVAGELVSFARSSFQPNAGFAWLDTTGAKLPERPQFLYVTCRMTYVAALEVTRTGATSGPDYDRVIHGIDLLENYFADHEFGGWFTSMEPDSTVTSRQVLDDSKSAYPHTFVVLAAATAVSAGFTGATDLLAAALETLETKFWDASAGMLVEDYSRDFTVLDPYRGANSNMHGVEALLAAYGATENVRYLDMATRISRRIVGVSRDFAWRLPEHFTAEWEVLPDYNVDNPLDPVRPYGSTPGHWLEWARLLVQLDLGRKRAGLDVEPQFLEAATAFFDQAFADAWEKQGLAGLLYTVDFSGKPLSHTRLHWVTCEAIGAASALSQVTEDPRYGRIHNQLWQFAAKYLMDPIHGSWHHELNGQNQPTQTIRVGKADIYHAYQAAVLAYTPLHTTVIEAVQVALTNERD